MTLALYRAYRPGSLREVVGQEHVTEPLRRALASGRIHHAYLFSGPRGCGKTSTARIMARSLNCAQGPTPDPCGTCASCVQLAPNGPGSPDVIELDAASHGGVDDTRELRERVAYSPAASRFRIFIIDEAHMVTPQGFNALLKVIEEPPDYVKFIFATTEPEKVLATIRSRTFNYSFRLVPVGVLAAHLAAVCQAEGMPFEEAAMPLVAAAGGGSVRDALSLLGQLMAGAGPDGLTGGYVSASLGLTDAALLNRVVAAIAARDGAEAFRAVGSVMETGQDARRFLTDLLGRLRDLIVLQHVPPEDQQRLLQLPADQLELLRAQCQGFGPGELSRAADLVSAGLSELKGATAPQLQLELVMARLMLPAADDGAAGFAARLDRLERALAGAPTARSVTPEAPAAPTTTVASREPRAVPVREKPVDSRRAPAKPASARLSPPPRLSDLAPATAGRQPQAEPSAGPPPATGPQPSRTPVLPGLAQVRESWSAVLAELGKRSRVAWTLWDSSEPTALADGTLTVAVPDQGRLNSIKASRRDELLRQVLIDVLRIDVAVSPVLAAAAPATEAGSASLDDPDVGDSEVGGVELLMREFGAVQIGEIGEG